MRRTKERDRGRRVAETSAREEKRGERKATCKTNNGQIKILLIKEG